MPRQPIHTDRAPAAIGPYSQAVRAGDTVYLSGQIPLDPGHRPAGRRRHRGAGAPRVRQPQGGVRSRRRLARRRRAPRPVPHRPRPVRRGQRGDGGVFRRAVSRRVRPSRWPALPRGAQFEVDAILVAATDAPTHRVARVARPIPALRRRRRRAAVVAAPAWARASPRNSPRAACSRCRTCGCTCRAQYEDRTALTPIRALQPGVAGAGRRRASKRSSAASVTGRCCAWPSATTRSATLVLRFFHFRAAQVGAVRAGRARALLRHAARRRSTAWRSCIRATACSATPSDALGEQLDPVYPAIEGIGPATLRRLIGQALDRLPDDDALELLPRDDCAPACTCRRCARPC